MGLIQEALREVPAAKRPKVRDEDLDHLTILNHVHGEPKSEARDQPEFPMEAKRPKVRDEDLDHLTPLNHVHGELKSEVRDQPEFPMEVPALVETPELYIVEEDIVHTFIHFR